MWVFLSQVTTVCHTLPPSSHQNGWCSQLFVRLNGPLLLNWPLLVLLLLSQVCRYAYANNAGLWAGLSECLISRVHQSTVTHLLLLEKGSHLHWGFQQLYTHESFIKPEDFSEENLLKLLAFSKEFPLFFSLVSRPLRFSFLCEEYSPEEMAGQAAR